MGVPGTCSCGGGKFTRNEEQGDEATNYIRIPSCFPSLEQKPSFNLDALLSPTIQEFDTEVRLLGIAFGFYHCGLPLWGYAILCIFLNIHGLNIYLWLSFIPAILVMLVGTKLEHVVSLLALEIAEPTGPSAGTQVKPRDELFWFGKPEIILRLIQFISFQNAFEMAVFVWSLWGFKQRSCYMKNHAIMVIRLISGLLVQFWCSYNTVPLSVIITQMGSKYKKALVAESVRESLHSWCKRVREKSKRSHTARSVCSLESTIDERDETATVASLTLSPCSSAASLNEVITVANAEEQQPEEEAGLENSVSLPDDFSLRISEYISQSAEKYFPSAS
ncbi:MLO-like protein 4 [Ancistrocladus abbreviatus]